MKLKKIASLMLAGVMAVSMLAGCNGKTEDNNGGQPPVDNGTVTGLSAEVLNLSALGDWKYVKAEDNAKLSDAVKAMAETSAATYENDIKAATSYLVELGNDGNQLKQMWNQAEKFMAGATNKSWDDLRAEADAKDGTRYNFYYVSGKLTDDMINNMIADKLDEIAFAIGDPDEVEGDAYEYTVSVAEADWLVGKDADNSKDGVIIGIAVTLDYTSAKF